MKFETAMSRIFQAKHPRGEPKLCSTEHELKIWFSKPNTDEPLGGIENELRLIKARETFPKHSIRLVYEPANLSDTAKEKLNKFCDRHQIELFSLDDVESKLKASRQDGTLTAESVDVQLDLLKIAKQECHAELGNLAAASDIVRILTPVLQVPVSNLAEEHHGTMIYTDFDEPLSSELPSALSMGEHELLKMEDNNNCLFACELENPVLQTVRQAILENYQAEKLSVALDKALDDAVGASVGKDSMGGVLEIMRLDDDFLQGLQKKLNNLQEEHGADKYAIDDVFSLRRAISDVKLNAADGKKGFWTTLYLKLVVGMSGPGVYNRNDLESRTEHMPMLSRSLYASSDLSWVPGSAYQGNLETKKESMDGSAQKITEAFKSFKARHASSINKDSSPDDKNDKDDVDDATPGPSR